MPNFSLFSIFLALGIVQGLITAFLLFRQKRPLNLFLGLLILNIALDLFSTFLGESHLYDFYPNLYFIPLNYNLGYGSLIFFSTIYFITPGIKLKKVQYLNFLPVFFQSLFYWIAFLEPLQTKGYIYKGIYSSVVLPIEYYGTILTMIGNLLFSYNHLHSYKASINSSSSLENRFYTVAKSILNLFSLLLAVWVLTPYLTGLLKLNIRLDISDILLVTTVYGLGYTVLKYDGLIKRVELDNVLNKITVQFPKSRTSPIAEDRLQIYKDKLHDLFDEQEIYKDPKLTLQMLADKLDTTVNNISYVINIGMCSTFNNLVNSYRVAEVERQIANAKNDHLTLLGIAYNSGFNSKSSFNLIFKQKTGFTPKAYKANIKGNSVTSLI